MNLVCCQKQQECHQQILILKLYRLKIVFIKPPHIYSETYFWKEYESVMYQKEKDLYVLL